MGERQLYIYIAVFVAGRGASASACCDPVRFDSTGLLAESENAAVISTYEYVPGEEGGYYRSRQNGLALYYYPSRGVSILRGCSCLFLLGCVNANWGDTCMISAVGRVHKRR